MTRSTLACLILSFAFLAACEAGSSQPSPGAAGEALGASPPAVAQPALTPGEALPSSGEAGQTAVQAPSVPGLRIAYLKGGDLWIWGDGAGARQLTSSQDVSAFSVSRDGSKVAFSRGDELWALQSDGTGERQLLPRSYLDGLRALPEEAVRLDTFGWFPGRDTVYFSTWTESGEYPLPNDDLHLIEYATPSPHPWLSPGQGGRLTFSPDGSTLVISSRTSIDVLDLAAGTRTTAHSYPGIANYETGYLPQVVWSPDSSGFKTVIPPDADNGVNLGPAQFLYIFPNGTVARLASFELAPLYETLPSISPDGGYVIYAARADQGKALYLMDSSGAARAYSAVSEAVKVYGWTPDAKHFVYGLGNPPRAFLGSVDAAAVDFPGMSPESVVWVDAQKFLALEEQSLVLKDLGGARMELASPVSKFEIVP
jgi:dipeptidyl aminopeptidase/acylaminoacyl peptidase